MKIPQPRLRKSFTRRMASTTTRAALQVQLRLPTLLQSLLRSSRLLPTSRSVALPSMHSYTTLSIRHTSSRYSVFPIPLPRTILQIPPTQQARTVVSRLPTSPITLVIEPTVVGLISPVLILLPPLTSRSLPITRATLPA